MGAKVVAGVMGILPGDLMRKVEYTKTVYAMKKHPQMITGREIVWRIYDRNKISTGATGERRQREGRREGEGGADHQEATSRTSPGVWPAHSCPRRQWQISSPKDSDQGSPGCEGISPAVGDTNNKQQASSVFARQSALRANSFHTSWLRPR